MRRKATPVHEKSMSSYELFAWRDAMSIALFLDEAVGINNAIRHYKSFSRAEIIDLETENVEILETFIKKSESQRTAYFKRITKNTDEATVAVFLTLCIIGCLRVMETIDLRDRFRYVLAPGLSNRITVSGMYAFSAEMKSVFANYDFPSQVFDAIEINEEF